MGHYLQLKKEYFNFLKMGHIYWIQKKSYMSEF